MNRLIRRLSVIEMDSFVLSQHEGWGWRKPMIRATNEAKKQAIFSYDGPGSWLRLY